MEDQQAILGPLKRAINEGYAAAKFWQNVIIGVQIGVFGLGVIAVFWPVFSPSFTPFAIALAAAFAFIKIRISALKGRAESLKRVYEYYDGLGEPIPTTLLADLEANFAGKLSEKIISELNSGLRFASISAAGERRALQNLQESAWWSKIGAARTRNMLLWVFGISFITIVVLLVALPLDTGPRPTGGAVALAKIVAAALLCIFSLNLLGGIWGFHRFAAKAQDIDAECERRLGKTNMYPSDAWRLMTEYQLARASAPMIPTFVWRRGKEKLNRAWRLHKTKTP
jgi:hypothetical protein